MINSIITQEKAMVELYKRGKVCLTAAKMLKIDSKYRPFLALFADGTFLVDERARTDAVIKEIIMQFRVAFPTSRQLKWQYVNANFLKAVYHKAQEFDWYAAQYPIPKNLSVDEVKKLRGFLKRAANVRCLSVTTPITSESFQFYSPDEEKFALFADGWLVISQNSPNIETLPRDISRVYPQISMVEIVPDYYVAAVYEQLLYTQPSAREIYMELEMAKIQQKLGIPLDKALTELQKNTAKWKNLLLCNERTARFMIYAHYADNFLSERDKNERQITKREN